MLKKEVSPSQFAFEDNQYLQYHNQLQQKHKTKVKRDYSKHRTLERAEL